MWRGGAGAVVAALLLLAGLPAGASASPLVVTHAARADTSPPLRKMHPLPATKGPSDERVVRKRSIPPFGGGPALTADPVQQLAAPSGPSAPATLTSWDGVPNRDGYYPPDTNGDVGLNDYVQWVNGSVEVWSKSGTIRLGPVTGNTFWSGFGGLCETTNEGDPVVIYDRMANRWILSQFAFGFKGPNPAPPYYQCFAVSTTSDPTGSYHRYAFRMNASNDFFPDYPKLGVWPDAYYMSTNNFNGNFFGGAGAYALDRAKMLAGDPSATMLSVGLSTTYSGLLPATLNGSTLPPNGAPGYFGAVDTNSSNGAGSTFQLWKFHADFTTPGNSTFTGPVTTNVAPYTWSFCGQLFPTGCIKQPGTTQTLDPLADRLMYRLNYRNFGDHESLVVAHTVNVGSDRAGMRWYELRSPGTTPTLFQQGTFAPSDGVSRWMGSVNMNGAGDIALGYSASDGTSTRPSVRYTGRLAGDAPGTMTIAEQSIVAGGGSQTGADRWGDYSTMSVDPSDDTTFWYTQEYYSANSSTGWKTRIGSFKLSGADSTPPDTVIDSGPSGATNNASPSFTFSSSEGGSTFECKLDGPGATTGSYASCTSPKSYSGLADGAYTFSVRATDSSSNTDASPATRSFTLDATAPQTSIDAGPSGTTSASYAEFDFSSNDGGATFQCNLDSVGWNACTSPVTLTKLAGGSHTFQVRASDTLGNTDATPASRAWTVSASTYRDTVTSTPNLLAYWRLGESSGTTAVDQLAAHDGLYENGTSSGVAGALASDPDTAAGFDGTDDDISTPSLGSTVDFTVEGWQRITDSANFNNTLYGLTNRVRVLPRPTGFYAGVWLGGTAYFFSGSSASNVGTWVHWALVRSGASLTLYRNGVQVATRSDLPSATAATLEGSIGRQGTLYPAKASIDDVAVYGGALSLATVQAHYLAGRAPTGVAERSRNGGAALRWNSLASPGVVGYDVYRATVSGGPYTKVTSSPTAGTSFADSGLTDGTTYFYVVRAAHSNGAHSGPSAEVSVVPYDAPYRDAVLGTSGLLAYWRLGEPSGTSAADELFAHNGVYENGTALGLAGALSGDPDTAAGFDGVDDHVSTGSLGTSVDFTVEGWERITDATNLNNTLYGTSGRVRLLPRPTGFYAGVWLGGTEYFFSGSSASNVGIWVHWALVRSGPTLTLYRNGVQVATRSGLPSATAATLQGSIGRQATNFPANGAIDDVAVYGVALSAATVQAHFLAG
jgi:hypothetical protein